MANEKGMVSIQPNAFVLCLGTFVVDYVKQAFCDSDAKHGTTRLSLIMKIINPLMIGSVKEP